MDISMNTLVTVTKFEPRVNNIHTERTVSQNFDLCPSFYVMAINGKFCNFLKIDFLYFIRQQLEP